MTRTSKISLIATFLTLVAGFTLFRSQSQADTAAATANSKNADVSQEVEALRAEVTRLKSIATDQSHVMKDVAYHFGNLWFAGQKKNWPLAQFYWSETRSHLRWAVRVIPIRKDPQGKEIKLAEILEPIEKTSLQQVGDAIKAQDSEKFTKAYKQMLDSCYACHLAAGKPYLRLQIPKAPEVPIIQFEPAP